MTIITTEFIVYCKIKTRSPIVFIINKYQCFTLCMENFPQSPFMRQGR